MKKEAVMAKKNISEIERGVGYLMGLVTTMMNLVRERDIPFDALYRLVTPAGRVTVGAMLNVALADWLAEQPASAEAMADRPNPIDPSASSGHPYRGGSQNGGALPTNHYRVYVSYDMPRDQAMLESEFSKDGVSELFYDNYEWQPHSSCAQIDQTPGDRVMLVKRFGWSTTSEANIAKMENSGYRPATHLEAYAFAKANPELQCGSSWIVALGSFAIHKRRRCVAVLWGDSGGRIFTRNRFEYEWRPDCWFLFVRK